MGQAIIEIRGRIFAVESKSGTQLALIRRHFEKRTDSQLDLLAVEFDTYASPDDSELAPATAAQYRDDRKADDMLRDLYKELTPWQKCQVARHPNRPHARDYIDALFTEYTPLAGDRNFATGLPRF